MKQSKGFTLIELVIVIVILGILASVAIPRFFNMAADAKEAACKSALATVRSAISAYYAYTATPAGGAAAKWPTRAQLDTPGVVLNSPLPDNPYSTGNNKNKVVAGATAGTPETTGTTGGWCYKPATGEFWADTKSGAHEADW